MSREEVRAMVEQMMKETKGQWQPAWLENLTFSGDLRLRYEYLRFAESTGGRRDDDDRGRYRLRVGVVKRWPSEDLELGFMLASGDGGAPTSTNETMGDQFFRDEIRIDRAYASWKPKQVPGLWVTGGKIAQPWVGTELVWDTDINPEGVWVQYDVPGMKGFRPFVAAGAFFLTYNNVGDDSTLFDYAAGFNVDLPKDVVWTVAANWYQSSHFQNNLNAGEEWDYINLTNFFTFKVSGVPVKAFADYVHNCGANQDTPDDRSDGYAFGVRIGQNKKKKDLSFKYEWRYQQLECSPAIFNDANFLDGHKGHVGGLTYNLTDYLTVQAVLFYTDPIYNPDREGNIVTLQADIMWRF
jgi:hypothetical protein